MDTPPSLDLDQIRARLKLLGRATWPAIADSSGVSLSAIKKFAYGQTADPSYTTVVAIARALPPEPADAAA